MCDVSVYIGIWQIQKVLFLDPKYNFSRSLFFLSKKFLGRELHGIRREEKNFEYSRNILQVSSRSFSLREALEDWHAGSNGALLSTSSHGGTFYWRVLSWSIQSPYCEIAIGTKRAYLLLRSKIDSVGVLWEGWPRTIVANFYNSGSKYCFIESLICEQQFLK